MTSWGIPNQMADRNEPEHLEQVAFFDWSYTKHRIYPFFKKLLFAIPNGGQRSKAQAGKLKAEGVKSGVSDVILLYPARGFHYLCLEFKAGKNKQSDDQKLFEADVDEHGGCYQVVYSSREAQKVILWYLGRMA